MSLFNFPSTSKDRSSPPPVEIRPGLLGPGCNTEAMASRAMIAPATVEPAAVETARRSKRKRAVVSYAPDDYASDIDMLDDEMFEDEEDFSDQPAKKKSKKDTKKQPEKLKKHEIFPFMELPPELRNRIYELALVDPCGVYITSKAKAYRRVAYRSFNTSCTPQFQSNYRRYWRYRNGGNGNDDSQTETLPYNEFGPALLAVSKQISAEANSMLYSQPFIFADNYAMMAFLTRIGLKNTALLRDVMIKAWHFGRQHKAINFPAISMLAPASNIESLRIACSVGWYYSYGSADGTKSTAAKVARKVFRDCYPFLEAVGRAKGSMAAAVDVVKIDETNFDRGGGYYGRGPQPAEVSIEKKRETFRKELEKLLNA